MSQMNEKLQIRDRVEAPGGHTSRMLCANVRFPPFADTSSLAAAFDPFRTLALRPLNAHAGYALQCRWHPEADVGSAVRPIS